MLGIFKSHPIGNLAYRPTLIEYAFLRDIDYFGMYIVLRSFAGLFSDQVALELHKKKAMYERKIPKDLDCGMSMIMEIIGSKWKSCLLFNIASGVNRPGQLQQHNPKASRQVLNQPLKELETHGIISRVVYAQLPPKVEYYLTDLGQTLMPILDAMCDWGKAYQQQRQADGAKNLQKSALAAAVQRKN